MKKTELKYNVGDIVQVCSKEKIKEILRELDIDYSDFSKNFWQDCNKSAEIVDLNIKFVRDLPYQAVCKDSSLRHWWWYPEEAFTLLLAKKLEMLNNEEG